MKLKYKIYAMISSIMLINSGCLSSEDTIESVDGRFSKINGSKIILDNDKGISWEDQPNNEEYNYEEANIYCQGLKLEEYSDWRLPTYTELKSIVKNDRTPTIDSIFENTLSDWYWTSSKDSNQVYYSVDFASGEYDTKHPDNIQYVRCVRSDTDTTY